MSQQTFEVMITDQQYRELQQHQQKNKALLIQVSTLELKLSDLLKRIESIQDLIYKKDSEINFLRTTLQLFAQLKPQEESSQGSSICSNVFEVLAQSTIESEKVSEREQKTMQEQFCKKYHDNIQKIIKMEEKLRSSEKMATDAANREELIKWLQKETDDLRSENLLIKEQVNALSERIKDFEEKSLAPKKETASSIFSKDETKDKIKALIDEYAREVENNLKCIEELDEAGIANLMEQEMKEIVNYISNRKISKE